MNKVTPISLQFVYSDSKDSSSQLARAYSNIFLLTKKNIIDKQRLEKNTKDKQNI